MIGLIRRFARDENAAVAFETVLMTPILVWVLHRQLRLLRRLSRLQHLGEDHLHGGRHALATDEHGLSPRHPGHGERANAIIRGSDEVEMRATQIGMVGGNYQVDWSYGVNGAARLFNPTSRDRDRCRSCRTASASSSWKRASTTKRPSTSA
jgi:hypothetical protein